MTIMYPQMSSGSMCGILSLKQILMNDAFCKALDGIDDDTQQHCVCLAALCAGTADGLSDMVRTVTRLVNKPESPVVPLQMWAQDRASALSKVTPNVIEDILQKLSAL